MKQRPRDLAPMTASPLDEPRTRGVRRRTARGVAAAEPRPDRASTAVINPKRDAKSLRSGRLRKELRP